MTGKRKKLPGEDLPPRVYKNHGAYYLVNRDNKWIRLGKTYREAMQEWAQLTGRELKPYTLEELWTDYEIEILPSKAPRTQADNRREIVNILKVFGNMRPADVRSIHVTKYLRIRGKTAPVRANREKALLSHMMTYAKNEKGLIDHNPCAGTGRNKEKPRDRLPTWWELKEFKKVAPEILQLWVDFKYKTGLRQQTMLRMTKTQLRPEGIKVRASKNNKKGIILWDDDLRAIVNQVKALPRKIDSIYLFTNRQGQPYTASGFRSMFHKYMQLALEKTALEETFTEHDIRAMHGTEAEEQGINATDNLLHKDRKSTEAYLRGKKEVVIKPLKRPSS